MAKYLWLNKTVTTDFIDFLRKFDRRINMKNILRIITVALAMCLFAAVFSGCRPDEDEELDPNRTQLYIANCYGGLGARWLENTIADFEEFYSDVSFEDDKTGVQVILDNEPVGSIEGTALFASISSSRDDLFFTQAINYYDFVNAGFFADITDVVTDDLAEFGEPGKTIEEKINPDFARFLKTDAGSYHAIPFYDGFFGFYYDVDLFEEKGFYFKEGATAEGADLNDPNFDIASLFVNPGDAVSPRSAGPDGNPATEYDNGLPATYDDFFALLQFMNYSTTPVIWSGVYLDYTTRMLTALWANNEGYDGMLENFNYSGKNADNLIDEIGSDGSYTFLPETAVGKTNGYLLSRQESRYQALQFADRLVSNTDYYHTECFSGANTHLAAQNKFLYSKVLSTTRPIGMLVEGSYWNNEASATFEAIAKDSGEQYSRQNRRIGIMPMPWPTAEDVGRKSTLLSMNDSYCFMNANSTGIRKELAEKFLKFAHTDKQLTAFTKEVGMTRALDYTISEEDLAGMSYYAQSMYALKKGSDVIYPFSRQPFVLNEPSYFAIHALGFTSKMADDDNESILRGNTYTTPFSAFKDYKGYGLDSKKYFEGVVRNLESTWSGKVN